MVKKFVANKTRQRLKSEKGDSEMVRKRGRTGKAMQLEWNLVPADYERLQAEVHRLRMENANLQSEVAQLKSMLQIQGFHRMMKRRRRRLRHKRCVRTTDIRFNVTKQSSG